MATVLTYGTYDIIHYGHVLFLKRAKELAGGGKLIVGLSTDCFHEKLKHKPKCYFTYEQRKKVLEGIEYVDEVFPEETWEQKAGDIKKYGAQILVMGDDWRGKFDCFGTLACRVVTLPRTVEGQDPVSDTLVKNDLSNRIAPSHGKLDLIFPFVDNQDPEWQKLFLKWKNKETELGANVAGEQSWSPRRFRSWNNLQYLFRGIEKNIPWIDKVFLVLSGKSQIPRWLDTSNQKLRIVFHDEYMPREVLPSFNALSIESFYSFIPGLSEYFIASNDDWFFLNPVPKSFFMDNGRLQLAFDPRKWYWEKNRRDSVIEWDRLLNNTYEMELPMHNRFGRMHLGFSHLPEVRCKTLEQEWFSRDRNFENAVKMFCKSKFRHRDNAVLNWFFIHLLKFSCDRVPFDVATKKFRRLKCANVGLTADTDFSAYAGSAMVAFNDCSKTPVSKREFESIKERLVEFLDGKFSEKCSFEK